MSVKSTIDFSRVHAAIEQGCLTAMPMVLALIESNANAKAPHDSGDLIGSSGTIPQGLEGTVYYDADYAPYQHEGQRKDGSHVIRNRPAGGESYFLKSVVEDGAVQSEVAELIRTGISNALG